MNNVTCDFCNRKVPNKKLAYKSPYYGLVRVCLCAKCEKENKDHLITAKKTTLLME